MQVAVVRGQSTARLWLSGLRWLIELGTVPLPSLTPWLLDVFHAVPQPTPGFVPTHRAAALFSAANRLISQARGRVPTRSQLVALTRH